MTNEQIREENIQRALEVGLETLLQDGVHGIQMQNIGDKVGVSSRSMTRYFGTKENYICAILEKMSQEDLKIGQKYAMENHIQDLSGIEQLRMFFNAIPKYYLKQGKKITAIMEAKMYLCNSDYQERVTEVYNSIYGAYSKGIHQILNAGIKDKTICLNENAAELYADSIMNTFWGLLAQLTFVHSIQLYSADYCNKMLQNYTEHILNSIEVK